MKRYVLLNNKKTIQLINMVLDKNQFKPVESITDRVCTVVSFETSSEVDEMEVYKVIASAWQNGDIETQLTINDEIYFLLFID